TGVAVRDIFLYGILRFNRNITRSRYNHIFSFEELKTDVVLRAKPASCRVLPHSRPRTTHRTRPQLATATRLRNTTTPGHDNVPRHVNAGTQTHVQFETASTTWVVATRAMTSGAACTLDVPAACIAQVCGFYGVMVLCAV
ncbi:unnamed protein product, partial [Ectocarpus sp. 12 AP-2014]